jgi:hypothetical protein
MDAALKVRLGLDNSQLTSGLKASEAAMKSFGSKVKVGANQAGSALTDLSRIAQDAPFGFVAIQNNINPLFESFSRLRAETGSFKGALSALGSSLMGPAGIGIAITAATTLLTILAQNGFFKSAKAADDAKKKLEDYKKAVESIFENAAKEATDVQSLIAVLNSETAARQRKIDAINELKKINPEIFGQIKLEGTAVTGLTAAYSAYVEQLKTVIAVKTKQKQLEDITAEILKKEGATLLSSEKQAIDILKKGNEQRKTLARDRLDPRDAIGDRVKADNTKALNSLYADQSRLLKDITELQVGVSVSPTIEPKVKIKKEAVEKELKSLDEIVFGLTKRSRKLFDLDIPVAPKPIIDKSYNGKDEIASLTDQVRAMFESQLRSFGVSDAANSQGIVVPITFLNDAELESKLSSSLQKFTQFKDNLQSTFQTLASNVASDFASSIGDMISGKDVDIFGSLFTIIGDGLIQLGKAQIAYATSLIVLKNAIKNPYLALAAGAAAIIAGQVMKNSIPKFAQGAVNGPTLAVVGDNPSGKEYMLPSESLGELASRLREGGGGSIIPDVRISGDQLILVFDRAQKARGRKY